LPYYINANVIVPEPAVIVVTFSDVADKVAVDEIKPTPV
jgi:hypothetical protein